MSAVAVWWVPDARLEFTRVSPTTNRCEVLPAKALVPLIDSANSISFRSIACWFSFDHCPLLSPTLSSFLSHSLSLSSTPLTHNCLSCLHATTDPRQPYPTQPPSLPHPLSLSSTHSQSFFLLFRHYRATAPRILYPLSSTVGANLFKLSSFRHQQGYSHETESTKCWKPPTAFTFVHVLSAPLRFLNNQDSLVLLRVCTSPVQHVNSER
jgi:hypothetical protein